MPTKILTLTLTPDSKCDGITINDPTLNVTLNLTQTSPQVSYINMIYRKAFKLY